MRFDRLITIQSRDEETERWADLKKCLARINRTGGMESYKKGGETIHNRMTFETRFDPSLQDIQYDTASYRIVWKGKNFNIVAYDDYFDSHQTIKLVGESYG